MDALRSKKQALKSSITRICNACSNHDISIDAIRVRVAKLDVIFGQYESIQDEIDVLTVGDAERNLEDRYRADLEDRYFSVKEIFAARLREDDCNRTVIDNDFVGYFPNTE